MNQRPYIIFLCAAAITVALIGTAPAQSSEPKTVADFLLLVPERYMVGYDRQFRAELLRGEHRGGLIDIQNGYISYDASDNPSGFEFATFKKKNGSYIVAYSNGAFSDPELDKELGNTPTFYLLSFHNGRWRDVTRSALPVRFDKRLAYHLPRHGKTIAALNDRGRKVYELTWKNDKFHVRRVVSR